MGFGADVFNICTIFYILPIPSVFSSFGFPCYCRLGPTMAPPPTKNPLKIVDFQGINFLNPYPGPEIHIPFMKPSALILNNLSSLAFLKKDLVLSLFATLLLPESPTRYSIFLIIFLLFKVFPFDQFLIKEPTAKLQLFFL